MPSKKNFSLLGISSLLLLTTLAFLPACSSKGCYDDMTVRMNVLFYTNVSGEDVSVTLDSLSIKGVGSDSLVYRNASRNGLELYLNPTADTTRFAVTIQQNGQLFRDTLTVRHSNHPWFQSMECGSMVFSTLKEVQVSGPIFNTAVIADSTVNTSPINHVKLYL